MANKSNKKKVWGYKSIKDLKPSNIPSQPNKVKTPNYPNNDNKYKKTKGGKK